MADSTEDILVVDILDKEAGLADVETGSGLTFQLPSAWLPNVADGAAYRLKIESGMVFFTPDTSAAAQLRERSKQTLLEFQDELES